MSTYYPPHVTVPVYAVFTGVGIALTALRFWTRKSFLRQKLGADDWLIAVGMAITCACSGIQFYNAFEGTGGEALTGEEAEERAIRTHQINYTMIIIEKPAFGCIKLSLLFFYRRIFGVWPSFNRMNNISIGIIIAWVISFSLADLLLCGTDIMLNFAVDQSIPQAQCGNKGILLLMFAITGVMTDLLVLGLPFLYIRRLQMAPRKKWAAAFVIMLGFISTGAGVLRTIFLGISVPLGRMDWDYEQPPGSDTPMVLLIFNPTFWVMIELLLGSWAANLPPLGPLLHSMNVSQYIKSIGSTFGSTFGTSRGTEKDKTWQSTSTERINSERRASQPYDANV